MCFSQYQMVFWISSRMCLSFWPQLIFPKLMSWAQNKLGSGLALTTSSCELNKPRTFYWLFSLDLFHLSSNKLQICAFACSTAYCFMMSLVDIILWSVFLFNINERRQVKKKKDKKGENSPFCSISGRSLPPPGFLLTVLKIVLCRAAASFQDDLNISNSQVPEIPVQTRAMSPVWYHSLLPSF